MVKFDRRGIQGVTTLYPTNNCPSLFDGTSHQMTHQPIVYGYSHLGYSKSLIYKLVAELYVKRILQLVVWYQPLIILSQETGHFHL